jgi:hypothetical protein
MNSREGDWEHQESQIKSWNVCVGLMGLRHRMPKAARHLSLPPSALAALAPLPPRTSPRATRPVDCNTGAALPLSPGYINADTLYDDMVTTGWSWFPYDTPTHNFNVTAPGWGLSGSSAACAEVSPGGLWRGKVQRAQHLISTA